MEDYDLLVAYVVATLALALLEAPPVGVDYDYYEEDGLAVVNQ